MSTLLTLVQPGTPWRGRHKACRGCGTTQRPELIDGHCADCFAAAFGPLGLADVPLGETTMATMTEDLPKLSQAKRRLCAICGQDKDEDAFGETEWYRTWPTCLACAAQIAVTATPALPVVPTPTPVTVSTVTKRCARCKEEKAETGFSASMWNDTRAPGSRWCRVCARAYHDEYKARMQQVVGGPAPAPVTATVAAEVVATEAERATAAAVSQPEPRQTVADELRALLDSLARDRAALLGEQERLTARLAEISTQCDAVRTTLALVQR